MTRGAETMVQDEPAPPETDREAVRRAAVRERLVRPMPADRLLGWAATLFVGAVAAALRLIDLGRPHRLVFDETYYAKDAFSLLRFGEARGFVDGADEMVLAGNLDIFADDPSFVVHPPAGKWLIAGGIELLGMDPTGWRLASALAGIVTAMLVVRAGRRLFRSTLLGALAGLLLAVDGMAIAVSRIALLDGILTMFIVAAFACLLIDRDAARRRYARWAERPLFDPDRSALGPLLAWRPWRLSAAVLLGLACATKWSGVFAVAAFGLLTVAWEVRARKAAGVSSPWLGALFKDGPLAFVTIVFTALVTYVATWAGWLAGDGGYARDWAAGRPGAGIGAIVPDSLRSLWHYHAEILHFHSTLTESHDYASPAWGWPLLTRPVSFDYACLNQEGQGCSGDEPVQEILALGTPLLWWGGCLALLVCLWRWAASRDWRAGAILSGVLATWVPWVILDLFLDRTTFSFYAVALAPFLVLAVAYAIGLVLGPRNAPPLRRTAGAAIAGAYVLCTVAVAAYFYPIHVDAVIPYVEWLDRMWFETWI
ncbi:MAG: dolichyl-phosphate-mannose--protein mannosyltransferase [Actinomycetota bacterium]